MITEVGTSKQNGGDEGERFAPLGELRGKGNCRPGRYCPTAKKSRYESKKEVYQCPTLV